MNRNHFVYPCTQVKIGCDCDPNECAPSDGGGSMAVTLIDGKGFRLSVKPNGKSVVVFKKK